MANQYSADVPKGFNVPKQVRLDSITGIQNEETLKDLGAGNNLAFKYYEGLKVYCKDEKTEYIWREVEGVETGLLDTHFVYPTYSAVDGIDYSGKSFNFFLIPNNTEPADGSETKLIEGTNVTITGTGTTLDPYEISSTVEATETFIEEGDNITITGIGTEVDPYIVNADLTDLGIVKTVGNEVIAPGQTLSIINNELTGKVLATKEYVESVIPSTPDGSETKINAGENVTVAGTGTVANPYIINSIVIEKEITSSTLIITEDEVSVNIEIPIISDIPALIVNSAYTGEEETGTASKPFKTIQAALDAYKGSGGRGTISDPTDPELIGSIIEIEKGSGVYYFTGDFDYKDLHISLREGVIISSTPIGSWLMNFNLFSTTTIHNPIISIEEGAYLYCNKNGFKLVGGDFAIGTNNRKSLSISGNSKKTGVVLVGTLESDILFEIDEDNLQYINGGYQHLVISSVISTNRGRMFVIKGNGVINCDNSLIYFLNDAITAVITNTYPPIEIRDVGILKFNKSNIVLSKTPTVTYNQLVTMYDFAILESIDSIFTGESVYFINNSSVLNTPTVKLDSCKMYILTTTSFAGNISGIWESMFLNNNNMPNTSINSLTTSITPSSLNTIGGEVIETLSQYNSRADAILALVPKGGKFINTGGVVSPTTGWFIDIVI